MYISEDNYLKNCGRHVYKKLGRTVSILSKKTYVVRECTYCKHVKLEEENA